MLSKKRGASNSTGSGYNQQSRFSGRRSPNYGNVNRKPAAENRGGPGPTNPSAMHDESVEKGVYKNKMFTYAASTLIGTTMVVETQEGKFFEGILTTWSPDFEIVLAAPHEVSSIAGSSASDGVEPESVQETMVFAHQSVVRYQCQDVDLDYANSRSDFQTDTQISNKNNNTESYRDLEKWEPEEDELGGCNLEMKGNGWAPEDMFKQNEDKYGVHSTYNPNMEGYTIQLSKNNTEDFKRKEARAAKIAREIEGSDLSKAQVELENGENEEDAFSAVTRPQQRGPPPSKGALHESDEPGKYVHPNRRSNGRGGNNNNSMGMQGSRYGGRTTTPPHHGGAPSHYHHRERDSHDDFSRGGGRGRNDYSGGGDNRRSSGGGQGYGNEMAPRHRQQQQYHGDKQVPQVSAADHHRSPPQKSRVSPSGSQASDHSDGRAKRDSPPQQQQQQQLPPPQQSRGGPASQASTPTGPRPAGKSQSEKVKDIKEFHDSFKLESNKEAAPTKKENNSIPHVSAATPETSASSTSEVKSEEAKTDMASLAKTSTLNPNAKEFSMNPNAKTFIPAGAHPSATPPARPQTPATPTMGPGGGQVFYPPVSFPMVPGHANPGIAIAHGMNYVPTSVAYSMAPGAPFPQPRIRGGQQPVNGPPRMSTPSDIPAMSLTGQPLLTSGPGGANAGAAGGNILAYQQHSHHLTNPGHQANLQNQQFIMRFPGNPVFVPPTSMQHAYLPQQQQQHPHQDQSGPGGPAGPASLPTGAPGHWQVSAPPPPTSGQQVAGHPPPPSSVNQPGAMTQTPPSSSQQPPPNTTPSPGPQHLMYGMQPQSLPHQIPNMYQFLQQGAAGGPQAAVPISYQNHVMNLAGHPQHIAALVAAAQQQQYLPQFHGQQGPHPMMIPGGNPGPGVPPGQAGGPPAAAPPPPQSAAQ